MLLELIKCFVFISLHHVRDITLGMQVTYIGVRLGFFQFVAYRLQQMCLAQAPPAINKEWVISLAGIACDLNRGSTG